MQESVPLNIPWRVRVFALYLLHIFVTLHRIFFLLFTRFSASELASQDCGLQWWLWTREIYSNDPFTPCVPENSFHAGSYGLRDSASKLPSTVYCEENKKQESNSQSPHAVFVLGPGHSIWETLHISFISFLGLFIIFFHEIKIFQPLDNFLDNPDWCVIWPW
jgi:hypothetical protein